MKRTLIFTLLACGASALLTAGAFAQAAPDTAAPTTSGTMSDDGSDSGPGGGNGARLLKRLTSALGLSGSQQAAIAPILQAAQPQLKAIREQAKTARDGVITSVSTQITPLLSGTQQARFAELVQHLKDNPGPGGQGGPGGKGGPHANGGPGSPGPAHPGAAAAGGNGKLKKFGSDNQLEHLTTTLTLTSDQQTQIKPILQAAHKQVQTILTNTTLTPQQKITQAKVVLEAANGQINGILTPAQQTQFAELRQYHHRKGADTVPAASASPSPSA